MNREKFNTGQLLQAISYLENSYSSSDTIDTYSKSPIHILVQEEILRFSKEEIDASTDRTNRGNSLFSISFRIKNPYIFSAFLKVGAFQDKICDDAKWLLRQVKNPTNDLYSLIFEVQQSSQDRNYDDRYNFSESPYANDSLFKSLFDSYYNGFNKLDTPEKIQIIDNYIRDFGKEKEKELLYFIYKNYDKESKRMEVCEYLVMKMKKLGIDFSQSNLLNIFLPEEDYNRNAKFFISSSHIPRIKNLLECGFKFNEKDYFFHGDNLFIAALKSNRKDIIETIIPHLNDVTPRSGTLEEQNHFVENYIKEQNDNLSTAIYRKSPELMQIVQRQYERLVLEYELKNDRIDKKKLKI